MSFTDNTQSQSNTRVGSIPLLCSEAIVDGLLAKVEYHASGRVAAALPDADTDQVLFVCVQGAALGAVGSFQPLEIGRNIRVRFEGTCNAGEKVVIAAVATPADRGMARKLPTAAGTYLVVGVAEENGVDGAFTLIRPTLETVIVASATIAAPAAQTSAAPAAQTSAALVDSSGGTPAATVAAITNAANAGSADVAPVANAIASLAHETNAAVVDIADLRTQLAAAVVDIADLRAKLAPLIAAAKTHGTVATA